MDQILTFMTLSRRVPEIIVGAVADRLVSGDVADCVETAVARVPTHPIHTRLRQDAVCVSQATSGNRNWKGEVKV